ncbi:MAG: hypothetical protein KKE49_03445 [Proteobacteria bacterium]|nr:hypothetical protein [Pseudomonadota bacterium]
MDYIDFSRHYALILFPAFFVIRAKSNFRFRRLYSREVDKTLGLRSDQSIILTGKKSRAAYPEALRRVSYFEKRPIIQIVKDAYKHEPEPALCNQLNLFNG